MQCDEAIGGWSAYIPALSCQTNVHIVKTGIIIFMKYTVQWPLGSSTFILNSYTALQVEIVGSKIVPSSRPAYLSYPLLAVAYHSHTTTVATTNKISR